MSPKGNEHDNGL
eukprot:gene27059-biopygen17623